MSRGFAGEAQKNYGTSSDSPKVGFSGLPFSPTEFYNLCENITTNIYTINTSWKTLQQALKTIGTERDNQGLRDKVHVTQMSCNQIVTHTTKDLQRLNDIVRKGGKQQKLQVEKLRNDFKEAVQQYSNSQQLVAEKIKIRLFVRQPSSGYNEEEEQDLLSYEQETVAAQKALQNEMQFEHEMVLEREQRIKQIEGDILDVNEIMRELGSMVYEQGEAINSIENNLENVHSNVEQGQDELEKAAQYQMKFRRKLCFLVILAIVVGIILTVIIVTQLR